MGRNVLKVAVTIVKYVFFVSISYILLYPFLYLIANSLKTISDAYDVTVNWVPKTLYWGNFTVSFEAFQYFESFGNTIVYELIPALLEFAACAVAAYGLSRFKLRISGILTGLLILNILVPSMMIIIPSYVNFSSVDFVGILGLISKAIGHDIRPNLINTPWVFILPSICGVGLRGGLFIYIFSQFFKSMPKELEEAAAIDGAGPWKTFFTIVLPSAGAAMITVILFAVVWHYNDYYLAQMYTNEQTLSIAVNTFSGNRLINDLNLDTVTASLLVIQVLAAGCLLYMIPLLVFYIAMQKKFVASVANSGIVG